uniref:G_PROTEIN_RECEP_F1_2 domain-containing protein n=1 Tax=Elaeophora elaphi TaxID=1147741 RepID=A0A0R3S750_9BILA
MDKIHRTSRILIIVSIVSVLNAFLAGCIQAEKSYHTEHFTNTHWITIISLFAGIASSLCPSFNLLSTSFILAVIMDIFALAICSAAVIADFFNLIAICKDFSILTKNTFVTRIQVYGLLSYSTVDMILSAVSVVLVLLILSSCHRSFLDIQMERHSTALSIIGCALIATSVLKFFSWIAELYLLRSIGNVVRYTFIHYTTDEPLWIALNIALGILCILRVPANSPTRIITFCLSSINIYPTVTYLWIDYRWFSNAVISGTTFAKWTPDWLSVLSLSTGIIHVMLLILLTLTFINSCDQPLHMNFSPHFKTFLFISGLISGAISMALFAFDIISTRLEAFYKIFHGNEQKTPFLTTLASAFLLFASARQVNFFVIPALLTTLLFCIQSTIFLLISYLYLSWNGYYADEVCEIFYRGSAWCASYLTIPGAISHFIETLLYFCVFIASCAMAYIIWRVIQANSRRGACNVDGKSIAAIKLEKLIEKIGLALLIAGAGVLITTVHEFIWNSSRHPLIVLLTSVYHVSLTITLLIFPLYQIVVSRELYANLLHCICLLMINAVRFADILTQLDYRNIGEATSWSWRIHNATEVLALGAHFATIVLCLRIVDIINNTRISHMPQPFVEFRNPLSIDQMSAQHYTYSLQDVQ